MLKPILALLLGTPLATATAAPAALSLEDSFDAHARVITQNDEKAKAALRNSLRTADASDIADIVDELYAFENLAAGFEEPAASIISARRKTIHCLADRIEKSNSSERGIVDYHCTLPDVSAAFGAYRDAKARHRSGEQSLEGAKAFLQTYAAILRDAPDTRYEARAEFSRVGDNGPWASIDMGLLGLELLKQLMPFQAWDERIEAEAVTAYSGIPVCDLMLDAQLKFAERYDPDSPLQRGTTLQDIVAEKVRSLGPNLAEAYCRGTHDRNRAVWEGPISQEDTDQVRAE
ncbi:hypothetical protein [Stenotrophomonas indicatrix]|jgi:hypothetical protein|uniref:hypothetical protein n=1 Tax=Stenotrophomonas indicatrix TaxID=2045451 RepID=UPI0028993075|nr:hypothetical protein [Stenotrophomonas indicatrix]